MKKLVFLFLIFCVLNSCRKINDFKPEDIENSILDINEIINFLPNDYKNESNLVFKNSLGVEKILKVNYTFFLEQKQFKGKVNYQSEKISIKLIDPNDPLFSIVIICSANYSEPDGKSIVKGLTAFLMPFNSLGSTLATLTFENGIIIKEGNFEKTLKIYSYEYKDVYVNKSKESFNSYSELDINSDNGIVAFRDKINELWAFERFVK